MDGCLCLGSRARLVKTLEKRQPGCRDEPLSVAIPLGSKATLAENPGDPRRAAPAYHQHGDVAEVLAAHGGHVGLPAEQPASLRSPAAVAGQDVKVPVSSRPVRALSQVPQGDDEGLREVAHSAAVWGGGGEKAQKAACGRPACTDLG